jgi:hypothetical protein
MITILLVFCALSLSSAADAPPADPWEPVRFLEGEWTRHVQEERSAWA